MLNPPMLRDDCIIIVFFVANAQNSYDAQYKAAHILIYMD